MLNPTDAAGWNVRDHITHLAAWAEGIAALLRRENRWVAMGLALDSSSRDNLDYDTMNAQIAVQYRHLSPAEAIDWLVAAHKRVIEVLEPMDETALILSYERFVAPFSRDGGRPIWGLIAGNTFGHYKQHTPWIEAIVESMSAS